MIFKKNLNRKNIINSLQNRLNKVCNDHVLAKQEALWLLEKLTKKTKTDLLLSNNLNLSDEQQQKLEQWIHLRVEEKKPLQYILETVPFCNLEILLQPPILIPRPETEEWCTWLIEKIKQIDLDKSTNKFKILDIGCGTGAIALSIAKAFPQITIIGIDINPNAVKLANKNKKHNEIKNAEFIISDLYENLENEKFDIIVSNPPYLSLNEWANLEKSVKDWEDKKALVGGQTGLEIYEKIIIDANKHLQKNSLLETNNIPQIVLEMGEFQANSLKNLLIQNNFNTISVHKDLEGKNRWICAKFA